METVTTTAEKVAEGRERILAELRKVIIGQDEVVEQVLIALFTGGNCLITGVPGLAKTLLIKTLADVLDLEYKRIQFTPDLMPSDITGTEILDEEQGTRRLRFVKGPVFAQIILADEINRTPPKTQAALLEAMQEYHVTAAGRTYQLERPFFVLATQNPIELEGTYPLPEAQLDRFMFNVVITYLSEDDEVTVVTQTTGTENPTSARILTGPDILQFQELARQVVIAEEIARYTVRLVDASRPGRAGAPEFVARLGTLELKARTIVEGFLSGLHRSPFKGFSVEFAEYRQYIPGDDLSTIDWRVYARSDRYYVKKFEEETNLDCHLMLDVSGSMGYGSHGITKFEYGACLAASLGYLMNRQRDAVGLTAFDAHVVAVLPARARPGALRALLVPLTPLALGKA